MLEIVIIALLAFIGIREYLHYKERRTFMNALLSKDVKEFAAAEKVMETKPTKQVPPQEPDLVPMSDVDDETFDKAIKKTVERK